MQEIAVVERLQPEILELQVPLRLQRRAEPRQVEAGEFRIDQFGLDAGPDEVGEILRVALRHLALRRLLRAARDEAQRLAPQPVEQQPRRDEGVVRLPLDQRPRGQDRRERQLVERDAVIEVAPRLGQDRRPAIPLPAPRRPRAQRRPDRASSSGARLPSSAVTFSVVPPPAPAWPRFRRRARGRAPRGRAHRRGRSCGARRASGPVRPGPGSSSIWKVRPSSERRVSAANTCPVKSSTIVVHAPRAGGARSLDGKERLGQRHRDLRRIERRHRAVAADDAIARLGGHARGVSRGRLGRWRVVCPECCGRRHLVPVALWTGTVDGRMAARRRPGPGCRARTPGTPRPRFVQAVTAGLLARRSSLLSGLPGAICASGTRSTQAHCLQLRGQRRPPLAGHRLPS